MSYIKYLIINTFVINIENSTIFLMRNLQINIGIIDIPIWKIVNKPNIISYGIRV